MTQGTAGPGRDDRDPIARAIGLASTESSLVVSTLTDPENQ